MAQESYRPPSARVDAPIGMILGAVFAFFLFVSMALAQMIGEVKKPVLELDESAIAMQAPELEEFEEEIEEEIEEEEETPELEQEPPELSLDQLDLALNPGTGGSLSGDFALPTINANQSSLGTSDVFDLKDLDNPPRPIKRSPPKYPRSLSRKKVSGKVIITFIVDHTGKVKDIQVESTTHPDFGKAAVDAVSKWQFEPGVKDGRKVNTRVRLPVPFNFKK